MSWGGFRVIVGSGFLLHLWPQLVKGRYCCPRSPGVVQIWIPLTFWLTFWVNFWWTTFGSTLRLTFWLTLWMTFWLDPWLRF
ncbi:uncharacterized protein B0T15DRAFT_535022 [Chaetomium strumarium]|uniref:Uncharacterized protein n=1 Tax=Chaetomium strumarium TaxID=1170767 RepID=A0AAJ0GPV4_9PEZI|nr:hypothetical protein B0T15DRAFT_535022 [Chaetomium strumarium]